MGLLLRKSGGFERNRRQIERFLVGSLHGLDQTAILDHPAQLAGPTHWDRSAVAVDKIGPARGASAGISGGMRRTTR
jgi:hypothetical protein